MELKQLEFFSSCSNILSKTSVILSSVLCIAAVLTVTKYSQGLRVVTDPG